MTQSNIPTGPLSAAFERAGRVHEGMAARAPAARQVSQASGPSRPLSVEQAIASASRQTSIDFDFLVAQAQVESAMDPNARARTSSATGLYQFIESTWLGTMQRHGPRFGLDHIASQISLTQSGSAYVSDPQTREAILALRNDPEIASLMAAGLAEDNRAHLAPILGRQPDNSELYLAHFLGAGGAGRFLSAMAADPNQSAAALFRAPAAANRPVFFERNGSPRSLAGVMDFLGGKLERALANAPRGMEQRYAAASLTGPSYRGSPYPVATPLAASSSQRPPYLIADESVFGPMNPPALTGANRPTISMAPMSNILANTFSQSSGQAPEQVRRAYDQLKALGF